MARLDLPKDHPAVLALSKCKVRAMLKKDCAFYASLILQSPVYWISEDELKTAATDGKNLFFNPEFFMGLDPAERLFLMLHEVMHTVYNHLTRRGFRDAKTWNEAGDYIINDDLKQRGYTMPKSGLHNADYRGMSTDKVYEILMKNKDEGNQNDPTPWPDLMTPQGEEDNSNPGNTSAKSMGGVEAPSAKDIEDHAAQIISQAIQASELANEPASSLPPGIKRDLETMLHPKLPWYRILAKFLNSLARDDYSWSRPNRRLISQGIFMPSLRNETVGRIDFAIDTSGSVSKDDFNHFMSEIGHVMIKFKPKEVGIIQFDHQLQGSDKVCSPQEFFKIEFKGGGGTNILPAIEEFKNNDAKALIILTDGYFHHNKSMNPGRPVIWCIYSNPGFVPEFGTAIHFDKD